MSMTLNDWFPFLFMVLATTASIVGLAGIVAMLLGTVLVIDALIGMGTTAFILVIVLAILYLLLRLIQALRRIRHGA